MASVNRKPKSTATTYEGARASVVNAEEQLYRTVMSCLLWEDNFYEDGQSASDRITKLVAKVDPLKVAQVAIDARQLMHLRHVPLLIARAMAKLDTHKYLLPVLLPEIIQRPDELTEFLAIYWKDGKQPLSHPAQKGLAKAFKKFNEYSLAKYNRKGAVNLKDVLFLTRPKSDNKEQEILWKKLADDNLAIPDTWEVELSAKGNNKDSWERLLKENKLGGMALIRNLRNMIKVGVDTNLIRVALRDMKTDRILPFRFLAAARYAPDFEPELESAMFNCLEKEEKIKGKTVILVDISGSMESNLSSKSEMTRLDAAYGVAVLARELCEDVSIYSFSTDCIKIPPRRGFALRDAIEDSQTHGSTYTGRAVTKIGREEKYDRIIIITDEQSQDPIPNPTAKGYIINIACYQNGIGYGPWTHINGWSEKVIDYIQLHENGFKIRDISKILLDRKSKAVK